MAEDTSQTDTEADDTSNKTTGNFVKDYLTGGGKKKWTKTVMITILVVIFFSLVLPAFGGVAIVFWKRSIAEPNGNVPCVSSGGAALSGTVALPANLTTTGTTATTGGWHENISTTSFGGHCDKSDKNRAKKAGFCAKYSGVTKEECLTCTDSVDNCMGSGGIKTGCDRPTEYFAALPLPSIPTACHGDVNKCYRIEVSSNGKSVILAVVDNGPGEVDKGSNNVPDYVLGNGHPVYHAGLDISEQAMKDLGGADKMKWRFTTAGSSASEPCVGGTSFGPGVMYQPNAYTAAQIDNYLKTKSPTSPLNGKGAAFVTAGQKYGVNPGFLLGITNSESSFGLQCNMDKNLLKGTNNAFGLTKGCSTCFIHFDSYEAGIDRAAANVAAPTYKKLDGTMREFRLKWCGYETEVPAEADHLPIKLSDGTSVNYPCSNKGSKWVDEVQSIMTALK